MLFVSYSFVSLNSTYKSKAASGQPGVHIDIHQLRESRPLCRGMSRGIQTDRDIEPREGEPAQTRGLFGDLLGTWDLHTLGLPHTLINDEPLFSNSCCNRGPCTRLPRLREWEQLDIATCPLHFAFGLKAVVHAALSGFGCFWGQYLGLNSKDYAYH